MGDGFYEDEYLVVDDRMIAKKAQMVLRVFENTDTLICAYNVYWTAHQPPRLAYSYYLIERRTGFFRRWEYIDSERFRKMAMPMLLRLGSCERH